MYCSLLCLMLSDEFSKLPVPENRDLFVGKSPLDPIRIAAQTIVIFNIRLDTESFLRVNEEPVRTWLTGEVLCAKCYEIVLQLSISTYLDECAYHLRLVFTSVTVGMRAGCARFGCLVVLAFDMLAFSLHLAALAF